MIQAAKALRQLNGEFHDEATIRKLIVNNFGQNLTTKELAEYFGATDRTMQRYRAKHSQTPEDK
jgi:transcriptional regulator GlxA family with amidase domain